MLVYTIWSLNRNKQRWEGTGKHGKGKKGICVKCLSETVVVYLPIPGVICKIRCLREKKRPVKPSELWKNKRINEILTQTHQ